MNLRPATIYFDESGHIYLPLLCASYSCLRLNQQASLLWRQWISQPIDVDTLTASEKTLLDLLLGTGALTEVRDGKEAA